MSLQDLFDSMDTVKDAATAQTYYQYIVDHNPGASASCIKEKTPVVPGTHHKPTEQLKDLAALKTASDDINKVYALSAKFVKTTTPDNSDKIKNGSPSDFATHLAADAISVAAALSNDPAKNQHAQTLKGKFANNEKSLLELFGANAGKAAGFDANDPTTYTDANFDDAALTKNLMKAAQTDDGKTKTGAVGKLITGSKLFYDTGTDAQDSGTAANFKCNAGTNKLEQAAKGSTVGADNGKANAPAASIDDAKIFIPGGTLKVGDPCLEVTSTDLLNAYQIFASTFKGSDSFDNGNAEIVLSVTTAPTTTLKTVDADKATAYLIASGTFMEQDTLVKDATEKYAAAKANPKDTAKATEAETAVKNLLAQLTDDNAQEGIKATLDTQFAAVVKEPDNHLDLEKATVGGKTADTYSCKVTNNPDEAACNKALTALDQAFCGGKAGDAKKTCQIAMDAYIDFINTVDTNESKNVENLMTTETEDFATCHKSLLELDGSWTAVGTTECTA